VESTTAGPVVASPVSRKETADSAAVNLTGVVAQPSKSMAGAIINAFFDVLMSDGDDERSLSSAGGSQVRT
jgi:hypothetical protein